MLPAAVVNIEAEQAILGACLHNADVLDMIEGKVSAGDFSEPLHQALFTTFSRARSEGRRIDVMLAKTVLGEDAGKRLYDNGPTAGEYLGVLVGNVPSVLNAPDYARVIAETANYRRLMVAAEELRRQAVRGYAAGLPSELATNAIAELDAVATSGFLKPRRLSVSEAALMASEGAEDRATHGVVTGVGWGLLDLDNVTRLYPGELTILAARPSMGKSTLGLATALNVARTGEGVLFFSLEMGEHALGQRVLADMCYGTNPIAYTDIRDGRVNQEQIARLKNAAGSLASFPLAFETEAGLTVSQIVARTRSGRQKLQRQGSELGLIVVDHLGLIGETGRYQGRHLELGAMTTALRALAKEMGVPVLLLCQLSRGVEGRDNKRPMLSDLRESGRIEEDADAVLLLYREAYYLERAKEQDVSKEADRLDRLRHCVNRLEVNVAKQRQGPTRTVDLFVSMPHNAVRNIVRGY